MLVKENKLRIDGGEIPIQMYKCADDEGEFFTIEIDSVEWLATTNKVHAAVMFQMMTEHITEYMNYKKM